MLLTRLVLALGWATSLLIATAAAAVADTTVEARLTALNNSGGGGKVTLTAMDSGALAVTIRAYGLVPGQPHAQHIHGSFDGGHFMCPSLANDSDGDGILTNEEAVGEYGTIFLSLTTSGDTSADSGLALERMPVADANGKVTYTRIIQPGGIPSGLLDHLAEVHIVQHGIDANGNGSYDLAALGPSTFAESLGVPDVPEEATNPATCGVITGAAAGTAPTGGIETGGGFDTAARNRALAVLGSSLLASGVALLAWRRRIEVSRTRRSAT